jgi:hypothetical protein
VKESKDEMTEYRERNNDHWIPVLSVMGQIARKFKGDIGPQ